MGNQTTHQKPLAEYGRPAPQVKTSFSDLSNEAKLILVIVGTNFSANNIEIEDIWMTVTGLTLSDWLLASYEFDLFIRHCAEQRKEALRNYRKQQETSNGRPQQN